jgi:hypothetical protein
MVLVFPVERLEPSGLEPSDWAAKETFNTLKVFTWAAWTLLYVKITVIIIKEYIVRIFMDETFTVINNPLLIDAPSSHTLI